MSESIAVMNSKVASTGMFGSFHAGHFELALPIEALREVVPFPVTITQVPLAHACLMGLFNLRGVLIPIVHMGRVLGLQDGECSEGRLAVVAMGESLVALLFDRTGDIFSPSSLDLIPFHQENDALNLVEGAFHLDDKILQTLSLEALSRLPGLSRLKNSESASHARHARKAKGSRHRAVSFLAGDRHMSMPIEAIQEIILLPVLEHSVLADARCRGWLNLRGTPVPIIDFASFMKLEHETGESQDDLKRVIVLRDNDDYLGLLVDGVDSIVEFYDAEFLPIPPLRDQVALFSGYISREEAGASDLLLLDAKTLFLDPSIAALTKGHRDLYLVEERNHQAVQDSQRGRRESWVTFDLDELMGLRIEQISEIIDYDPTLVPPPDAPLHIRGILNLRQTLITVVDLRSLYGMAPSADLASSKILVVQHEKGKYGLVVDAIRSIMSIDGTTRFRVPSLVSHQLDSGLRQDVQEFVKLPDETTIMLMNAQPLLQRLSGVEVEAV